MCKIDNVSEEIITSGRLLKHMVRLDMKCPQTEQIVWRICNDAKLIDSAIITDDVVLAVRHLSQVACLPLTNKLIESHFTTILLPIHCK